MRYLVFDTETTGLPARKSYDDYFDPTDLEKYDNSRLVSIAWVVYDGQVLINKRYYVIKPEGFSINPRDKSTQIHGITQEIAEKEGRFVRHVLNEFYSDLLRVNQIVAHNLEFDRHIVLSELHRLTQTEKSSESPQCKKCYDLLSRIQKFCTMKCGKNVTCIPSKYGNDYKYPKLNELHMHLFSVPVLNAHHALADVEACNNCFQILSGVRAKNVSCQ